ncbi:MAG: hypothetical protein [Olavius algarvensis Gamma 1 endosymbiont]|nr:MAG: hypothetical protein [Olavius algarvensis Gamma 1 endosymbiont]
MIETENGVGRPPVAPTAGELVGAPLAGARLAYLPVGSRMIT